MIHRILIIFSHPEICPESLTYAREFALRMDAEVTFLMLAPMSFAIRSLLGKQRNALNRIESRAASLLARCMETFIQEGISVSSALRVGDPGQELLKFLADRPPFQAAIWGSGTTLPGKGHWLAKVSGGMECPLLTISKRER